MKQIHFERLKIFAEAIETISGEIIQLDPQVVIFLDEEKQIGFETPMHIWVFQELPFIFKDFEFKSWLPTYAMNLSTQKEELEYVPASPYHKLSSFGSPQDPFTCRVVASVMFFFNLDNIEVLLHLFGACSWMQQPEIFGGKVYDKQITAKDIADNIHEYIIKMEKEEEIQFRNRLLKFADFLAGQIEPEVKEVAKIRMRDKMFGTGQILDVEVNWWLFLFLPECFANDSPTDWYFPTIGDTQAPIYGNAEDPELGDTITCVFKYFGLSNTNEFICLFGVEAGNNCKTLAQNIVDWIEERSSPR